MRLKQHLEMQECRAVLEQLPGHRDMMLSPEKAVPPDIILSRIRQWAIDASEAAPNRAEGALTLADAAIAGRTRRRPVRFGPSQRVFGILTEPIDEGVATFAARRPPVLLVTGGAVPRTSRNRMYIVLATRLAEMGHTVLRMDVSGIGESPAASGVLPNDPYAAGVLDDVGCAMRALLAHSSGESISLLGLCSGAYATFQTALADSRVRAAVLLNPEVFHLRDGSPSFSDTELSLAANQYRQSLVSKAGWKKLLSGNANVRYIVRFTAARLRASVTALGDRLLARIRGVPQGLAGDFHHLLTSGVKLSVVVARGDPGQDSLMKQLGPHMQALDKAGFRLKTVPGPDHAFNDLSVREHLIDWLVEILSETRR
jgi:dienelactone hydrolase